jgi:hypothetical protein
MADLKNQHFVPRCLFKPFTSRQEGKAINLYNIRHQKLVENASVRGQCARDYLYDHDGKLEEQFSELEGAFSTARRHIAEEVQPKDDELERLRFFAYLQHRRTEQAVLRMKKAHEAMQAGVFGEGAGDSDIPSNHQLMMQSLQIVIDSVKYIYDLKVRIIENKTENDFVLCDDPAVFTNKFYFQKRGAGNFGVANSGALYFLPITPRHCVLCYDGLVYTIPDVVGDVLPITSKEDVETVNELQYLRAAENIYFRRWEDANYVRASFEAGKDRRPKETIEIQHFVLADANAFGEKWVPASAEDAKKEKKSMVHWKFNQPNPSRWLSKIKFRSSPRTFDIGSAAGPVRDSSWLEPGN